MNEVEKMYENAGVEADYDYFTFFDDKVHKIGRTMHLCKEELKHWLKNYQKDYVAIKVIRVDKVYPPFTAEKQLSLMAFLINRKVGLSFKAEQGEITVEAISRGLAGIVNRIWQDLTEEECKQVKGILE